MGVCEGGAPTGVVTFLFTDVEGSTRRWEANADEMRAALATHDGVLRDAIEAHGGFLFKHTGDGVCAAFSSPRSAVATAIAAQRRLQLPVRMGLATGTAELRDGDYFGVVLNRAARLMAAGHGGQILLADSTADQLDGVDLLDLGPRRLRDVPTAVRVFQILGPGLRADFPPLKVLDATPGNLKPGVTSFIGREREVDELKAAVRARRLVTLTGVGGVGKTRLATEVATNMTNEFADGVWLFELAAVTNPAAVPDAVAAVLKITQQPDKTVSESVAVAQEGRARLLVFDNCEHVLEAAADLVETILASSATVRILATSREGLDIAEEQLWPVSSLDVTAGTDSAAVTLFAERARNVWPGFTLSEPDEGAAVLEICDRLDGVPLAIELAASRMASMTASEVRDRLGQRFQLLVGSRRDIPHHQSLRYTVQWSYDLLQDPERDLLDRCSVFAGGFDLQSACAVSGSDDANDYAVLDLLDALVRKSLLVAERSSRRTRFSMLETIRQFAEEQLVAKGAEEEIRNAHASYFASRETEIMALWDSPRQREAYKWFGTELANLRIAFRWATQRGQLDEAATIATYAGIFGYLVENLEPIPWAEELIESARSVNHQRLATLYMLASQCGLAGRIADAIRYREAAQDVIISGGEILFGFEAILGRTCLVTEQPELWAQWCSRRLAHAKFEARPRVLMQASMVLLATVAGMIDEAVAATDGLIEAAEATGNAHALSYALMAFGFSHRNPQPIRALDSLRRGLMVAHDNGIRVNESFIAMTLGPLEAEHGDPRAALDYVALSIRNYYDAGNTGVIRMPLACLAAVLDRLGRIEAAATIAGFAINPRISALFPEIADAIRHLRSILGDPTYESLARRGAAMTISAMATYAYDQTEKARTQLVVST
jgi:predicted ATPase/class 3 adenylate cyclase